MAWGPTYSSLPTDGSGRKYVDQPSWDAAILNPSQWPDNVNANNKTLSNVAAVNYAGGGSEVFGPGSFLKFLACDLIGTTYSMTAGSWAAGSATITIGPHNIIVGQYVGLSGASPGGWNFTVAQVTAITTGASGSLTVAMAANPGAWSSGGTLTVTTVSGAGPSGGMEMMDPSFNRRTYNGSVWGFASGGPAGPGYTATSTTSLTIGTGSLTFTTQTSLAYLIGDRVRLAYSTTPTNYMEGKVTAYNSGTGSMTVNFDHTNGSGTFAAWNIGIAGDVGATGATGATGPGYLATSTTSVTIGTGSQIFTTQAGLAYMTGDQAIIVSAANSANYMQGQVTSYSGTSLVVSVTVISGSGAHTDWNISLTGLQGPGYAATSATSVTISTGSQTFTTQSGLAYSAGVYVIIASQANTANNMIGTVTSYSGSSLVVNVTIASGSGAHSDWNINISGPQGAAGSGLLDPGSNGIVKRTALNTTAIATASDFPAIASIGTIASLPAAGTNGHLYIPTDSYYSLLFDNGSAWKYFGPDNQEITPPSNGSFSWVNQGSASVSAQTNGAIVMTAPGQTGDNIRAYLLSAPGTPYAKTFRVKLTQVSGANTFGGVGFYESSSGKFVFLAIVNGGLSVFNFTNSTTFSAVDKNLCTDAGTYLILKLGDDGTNLTYSFSYDGINFVSYSTTRTHFFTTAPDKLGLLLDPNNSSTFSEILTLISVD